MVNDHRSRYVDFEVAFDGPVLTSAGDRMENYNPIPVDDLIICEECLKAGAGLIGMEQVDESKEQASDLKARIADLEKEIKAKDRAISDLTHSVGVVVDHPIKRPPGRPKIKGPDTHEPEMKKVRQRRKMADKVSASQKKKKAEEKEKATA